MIRRILLFITLILSVSLSQAQEQNEQLALETVARINEWRLEENVWPLKINPILTNMAISHASYLVSLEDLPENLHAGETGLNPRERALLEPFEWPHYQLPEQIAVGENAGIGTLDYAMNFWANSDIHKRTSLNPVYREVGVAALPYHDGHLFIVVFGGRPNILPALLDPRDGQTIYLTNEQFEYAQFFDSMQSIVDIQMFNDDGLPLFDEPQPWSPLIEIPEDAGDNVYLLMSDGTHQVLTRVNRETDQIIMMSSLTEPEPTEIPSTPDTEVVTDDDTISEDASAETPSEEATPEPTVVPTVEPTSMPEVDQPDMLIVYTADTLDALNVTGANADWQNIELNGVITVPFTQFTKFTDLDLSAVPDRHCVQIRSGDITGDVTKQESCRWVRSLVTVQPDRLFWLAGDFQVIRNGSPIATCYAADSVCEVYFDQ